MNWLQERPFLTLLVSLVPLMVVYPLVHDQTNGRVLFDALFTSLFLVAFTLVFKDPSHRLPAVVLGIPTLIGVWTDYVFPDLPGVVVPVGFHLMGAAFLAFTVATILRVIYSQKVITADSIYGAFSGYFLIGLTFGHLYCVVELLVPGSFQGPGDFATRVQEDGHQRFLLTYFSLITLTTVGYGDIMPVGGAARGLASVEAVIGQFYLVVLMAELIGVRIAHATQPPPSSS